MSSRTNARDIALFQYFTISLPSVETTNGSQYIIILREHMTHELNIQNRLNLV